jgi:hypothetical protein
MATPFYAAPDEMQEFYARLDQQHAAPLWE